MYIVCIFNLIYYFLIIDDLIRIKKGIDPQKQLSILACIKF